MSADPAAQRVQRLLAVQKRHRLTNTQMAVHLKITAMTYLRWRTGASKITFPATVERVEAWLDLMERDGHDDAGPKAKGRDK